MTVILDDQPVQQEANDHPVGVGVARIFHQLDNGDRLITDEVFAY